MFPRIIWVPPIIQLKYYPEDTFSALKTVNRIDPPVFRTLSYILFKVTGLDGFDFMSHVLVAETYS